MISATECSGVHGHVTRGTCAEGRSYSTVTHLVKPVTLVIPSSYTLLVGSGIVPIFSSVGPFSSVITADRTSHNSL